METKLIIIFFPILILLLSYNLISHNINFYKHEFEKHGVYDKLPKETVNIEAQNIINYLKYKTQLEVGFFNEKEISHMEDVYKINKAVSYIFYTSLIIILFLVLSLLYSKQYKTIYSSLFYGGIATLGIILIFIVTSYLFFTNSFTIFHEVFFDNDLWMMNPEVDKIIVMFPEPFFFDSIMRIMIYSSIFSFIVLSSGFILRRFS